MQFSCVSRCAIFDSREKKKHGHSTDCELYKLFAWHAQPNNNNNAKRCIHLNGTSNMRKDYFAVERVNKWNKCFLIVAISGLIYVDWSYSRLLAALSHYQMEMVTRLPTRAARIYMSMASYIRIGVSERHEQMFANKFDLNVVSADGCRNGNCVSQNGNQLYILVLLSLFFCSSHAIHFVCTSPLSVHFILNWMKLNNTRH